MDEEKIPPVIPPPLPGTDPADPPSSGSGPIGPRPWGFWATIGFSLLIGAGYLLAQVVAVIIYGIWLMNESGEFPDLDEIEKSGLLLALATLLSAPAGIGLSILFAWLRKGIRVRDYLGLCWPEPRSILRWALALAVFVCVSDVLTVYGLNRPIVPEVMVDFYRTTESLPLLWLAIVVAAPAVEEFIFRGFLLSGLRGPGSGRLRTAAAIALSSALWAVIHLQYDAYGIATIFISGIFLGYARIRTGSVLLCILLHVLMNLVSTVEVAILLAAENR